jgi:hypothetical protein
MPSPAIRHEKRLMPILENALADFHPAGARPSSGAVLHALK